MTNRKTTRRALVLSLLSLLVCCSMLVGTTFAWFTDSVTSGNNKIVAGNLDVELYNATSKDESKKVSESTKLFDEITLWEPGVVAYENLTVANVGTLALKYQLSVNFTNATATPEGKTLADVLKVAFVKGGLKSTTREGAIAEGAAAGWGEMKSFAQNGELKPGQTTEETFGIVIYWEPGANDNDFNMNNGNQGLELSIDLGINLFATQLEAEMDSFGNDYDAAAPYDLPSGFSAEDFGTNVAVDGDGNLYATLTEAVKSGAKVLYMAPGADLGTITHLDVADDLTIYGNDAYISGGEHDLAVDTYAKLTKDIALNIYKLDGVAVWGQRNTEYTVNINLYDCQDMNRVYISGTSGANNITLEGCSFNGFSPCSIYSNANGTINVLDTTFTNVGQPINLNHKVAGTQTVNVKGCDFINCGNMAVDSSAWAAPIRALSTVADSKTVLTVSDVTFTGAKGYKLNGDILLNDTLTGDKITLGTVEATVDASTDEIAAYPGTTLNGVAISNPPATVTRVSNADEMAAAIENGATAIALSAGTYKMPSSSGAGEITIVGPKNAVIDNTLGSYLEDAKLSFEGVTIKGSTGMANGNGSDYAALYSKNVTYTNCTFDGPFRVGRDGATFIGCTFTNLGNDYVWTYGNDCTFIGCTFQSEGKALLIYSDGGSEVAKVTVKDCTFNATQGRTAWAIANQNCAAIEIDNYGNGVDLTVSGCTVNSVSDTLFSGLWRIKSYNAANPAVIVNGTTYTSVALDGKLMTVDADRNATFQ